MSSIGSIGSSFSHQTQGPNDMQGKRGLARIEEDLTSFLSNQGVSTDDQAQILAEVRLEFSKGSTSTERPNRNQLLETVSKVLNSHGIDGDKFAENVPLAPVPLPGGHGGQPPIQNASSDQDDDPLKVLLNLLAKTWRKAQASSDSATPAGTSTTISSEATASPDKVVTGQATETSVSSNSDDQSTYLNPFPDSAYLANFDISDSQSQLNVKV